MSAFSSFSMDQCDPRVLDVEGAVDRIGGDLQLFRELAEIFLDDSGVLFEDLRGALAMQDQRCTERFSHSLKAIAANVGGVGVEAKALAVEEAARAGDLSLAERGIIPLMLELNRLNAELRVSVLGESRSDAN